MTVSCMDSVLVSKDFIQQIASTYGENSNAYRVRVLGEFPRADDDTVIPLYLTEGAQNREIVLTENAVEVWGLDVARQRRSQAAGDTDRLHRAWVGGGRSTA
jgi:hypothetical protein